MAPDLSDRDRERFEQLRSRLEGVAPADRRPDRAASPGPVDPMLATEFEGDLSAVDEDRYVAESKYDGTRLIVEQFDGAVSLYTRRHVERSTTLPELTTRAAERLPDGVIIDGEYTFRTPEGVSHFTPIHASEERLAEKELEGTYFAFDVLAVDAEWCTREPLERRKERLDELVPSDGLLSTTEVRTRDFQGFYDDQVAAGEEGIMLKRLSSPYHVGTRSTHWRKVKAFRETDVVIVGYTAGEGWRGDTFGALVMTDGERYVGRVGSGFTESELDAIMAAMTPTDGRPVPVSAVGRPYTTVEPFVAQVKYQEVTPAGDLRAPVFLRLRPDKPIDDVEPIG